jgi:anti-sigma factor RsiW
MMDCNEIRGRFALYLDNELQGDDRVSLEEHLRSCESCASSVDKERAFLDVVRHSRPLHVASPELRAKVQDILESDLESAEQRPPRTRIARPMRIKVGLAVAATLLIFVLPLIVWRVLSTDGTSPSGQPSSFALMAADTHLRRTRGQLPLETETGSPQDISNWFANKVNFSVKLPNYQELSGQEKLYTLEGARLVGYKEDYAAYVAYEMKGRPISLVITSDAVAKPAGGEEIVARGLKFHYDAIQGLKVITWSDRGLTYALVSDLEERGQESCIVCHQGTKDQDLIAPLSRRK